MPIAATPFEHAGELPVATKWTGELDVVPFAGEETVTTEKAGNAKKNRHTTERERQKGIPTSPDFYWQATAARAATWTDSRTVVSSAQSKIVLKRNRKYMVSPT
jgi:hypothetical protein